MNEGISKHSLLTSCNNCGIPLPADGNYVECFVLADSGKIFTFYEGLQLIFKNRKVDKGDALTKLLRCCTPCGLLFSNLLQSYFEFRKSSKQGNYVHNIVYDLPSLCLQRINPITQPEGDGWVASNRKRPTTFSNRQHTGEPSPAVDVSITIDTSETSRNPGEIIQLPDDEMRVEFVTLPEIHTVSAIDIENLSDEPVIVIDPNAETTTTIEILPDDIPPKSHECIYCKLFFPSESALKDHLFENSFHSRNPPTSVRVKSEIKSHLPMKRIIPEETEVVTVKKSPRHVSPIEPTRRSSRVNRNKYIRTPSPTPRPSQINSKQSSSSTKEDSDILGKKMVMVSQGVLSTSTPLHPLSTKSGTFRNSFMSENPFPYKCSEEDCMDTCFATLREWILHQEEDHNITNSGYEILQGNKVRKLSNDAIYPCLICGKVLRGDSTILLHIRTAHPRPTPITVPELPSTSVTTIGHQCTICGLKFGSRKHYTSHMEIHTGTVKKKFGCEKCELKFNSSRDLRNHTMTHTNEKPFKCQECGRGFRRQHDLKYHINRIHTKEVKDKVECSLCKKTYCLKQNLSLHLMNIHNMSPEEAKVHAGIQQRYLVRGLPNGDRIQPSIPKKPSECYLCGKTYSGTQRMRLVLHMVRSHGTSLEEAKEFFQLKTSPNMKTVQNQNCGIKLRDKESNKLQHEYSKLESDEDDYYEDSDEESEDGMNRDEESGYEMRNEESEYEEYTSEDAITEEYEEVEIEVQEQVETEVDSLWMSQKDTH